MLVDAVVETGARSIAEELLIPLELKVGIGVDVVRLKNPEVVEAAAVVNPGPGSGTTAS